MYICTLFHNLSNIITFAAAPLVLTPFVRNRIQDYKGAAEQAASDLRRVEALERRSKRLTAEAVLAIYIYIYIYIHVYVYVYT